ncbi:MAG: type II toxin-antitoxin system HicB family antitoxin [Rhodobacter sp.]|nr:type II toxin-antitoxin system HicB family antitoxin [Rhodobacter sp.]
MRYAVVIEKARAGFSGYVPDLPGCVAAGASVAKVRASLETAIPFHIKGLKAGGAAVPLPESAVEWVEVEGA